jgi:hypothetical protein
MGVAISLSLAGRGRTRGGMICTVLEAVNHKAFPVLAGDAGLLLLSDLI